MVIMAENSDISEKQIIHLWESLTALPQTISLLVPEPIFLTYHKTRTWLSGCPLCPLLILSFSDYQKKGFFMVRWGSRK